VSSRRTGSTLTAKLCTRSKVVAMGDGQAEVIWVQVVSARSPSGRWRAERAALDRADGGPRGTCL
jgi:hypothetical protein